MTVELDIYTKQTNWIHKAIENRKIVVIEEFILHFSNVNRTE